VLPRDANPGQNWASPPLDSSALPPSDSLPLVSVVIPAYAAHAVIARALDSVFSQTYPNLEVLVVNDGSPDTDLLEACLQPYLARIRYIKQENQGPSGARNVGVAAARGYFVAFLDSDDAWLPHHVETQVRLLTSGDGLDLAYADSMLIESEQPIGHAFGSEPQKPPVTFEALLREDCTVGTSSTVARRQSLVDAGLFDPRFRRCEDFDLWLRMRFRGARMDFSPDPGVRHYLSVGSLAHDTYLLKRDRIEVYRKTAATLPISDTQRSLIQSLIAKTEANCQKDLLKDYLRSRDYKNALAAAEAARRLSPHEWRLRAAVFGLRKMPSVFRQYHRLHERLLQLRGRVRAAQRRNLNISTSNARS